jgi:hypothetical protein
LLPDKHVQPNAYSSVFFQVDLLVELVYTQVGFVSPASADVWLVSKLLRMVI